MFRYFASLENLFDAWESFRKGKRSRGDVMVFERRLEDNIFALHADLMSGNYRHGPYERFVVHDPKQRTIHKACVRDRIVHQALVNVIELEFEMRFIYDSFSCRRDKGTHAAIDRLRMFLRRASKNDAKTIYALKCDVRKFFDSIDHDILLCLLRKHINDESIMHLLTDIVQGFAKTSGCGIPLGNVTSQLFANVYLHELDWFVKHTLRIKHYVRYCDDFVILTASRIETLAIAEKIDAFLQEHLKLALHPNKTIVRTWTQGIDFLGYVLLPQAIVLRPSTARRIIQKVTSENAPSYLGVCSHANAYETACILRHKGSQTTSV